MRWIFGDNSPFFEKGKGRSPMVSDFLVSHNSSPFFRLNDKEYSLALEKYPELGDDEHGILYEKNSATASIVIGTDNYFNNESILSQFERLFKLLQFKNDYRGHNIHILVDNATIYTTRSYSDHDFGKNSNTRCPVNFLEWTDEHNKQQRLDCYISSGSLKGKSKGLLQIGVELGLNIPEKINLVELKELLSKHRAFQQVNFNVKLFFPSYLLFLFDFR
jgi:hypothetical protein